VLERRSDLHPVEALAGIAVVRVLAQDPGVLDDGAVVILEKFGLPAVAQGAGRGAAAQQQREEERRQSPSAGHL
jgi:hypothetical protein